MEWSVIEHDKKDVEAINDLEKLQALRFCGLYKFWMITRMKSQLDILTWMVRAWDGHEQ